MATPPQPPKRILIVDDSPDLRSLLSMGLDMAGYQTATAENGAAAMPLVERETFDLILLDLHMPVMDGLHFLEWLRGKARIMVPVLVFTSSDVDDNELAMRERVQAAGATDLLPKPAQLPVVLERVARLI